MEPDQDVRVHCLVAAARVYQSICIFKAGKVQVSYMNQDLAAADTIKIAQAFERWVTGD